MLRARGALTWVYAKEPDLLAAFQKQYPQARVARTEDEVLQDSKVKIVLTSGIPEDRGPLAVRAMRHGKDFMSDKPGMTTLAQLAEIRKVQAETKRIFSIMFSERFENQATVKAGELVRAGAIGRVLQTVGLGPHRMSPKTRPGVVLPAEALRRNPLRTSRPIRPTSSCSSPVRRKPTSSHRRSATWRIPSIRNSRTSGT